MAQKSEITGVLGYTPDTPGTVILNDIRTRGAVMGASNFSDSFMASVPVLGNNDLTGLQEAGNIILGNTGFKNEFVEVINRIVDEFYSSRYWKNKLAWAKKGEMPVGFAIEEIYNSPAKGFNFDKEYHTAADWEFLKQQIPDVKVAVHKLNLRRYYKTEVNNHLLRSAFVTMNGMYNMIEKIIETLYRAAEIDDFLLMKYVVVRQIVDGNFAAHVVPPLLADNADAIVTVVKKASNDLTFPDPDTNVARVLSHSDFNDQFFIGTSASDAIITVNSLASAFNRRDREFLGQYTFINHLDFKQWEVDRLHDICPTAYNPWYRDITTEENTVLATLPGVIIDRDFYQIWDQDFENNMTYNQQKRYWLYYYHMDEVLAVSPFAPGALFVPAAQTVTSVTVTPSAIKMGKGTMAHLTAAVVTTNFAPKSITWSIAGANSADTKIDQDGNFIIGANETATTITVKATSDFNTQKSGSATVTVQA